MGNTSIIVLVSIGVLIGLVGGILGSYFSIKNTNSVRERNFAKKMTAVIWTIGIIFIALLLFLPSPYKWLMWIPYSVALPLFIIYGNKRQTKIRAEESSDNNEAY